MMDEAAWKELSKDFPWTERLLEKYMNYVDWKELSAHPTKSVAEPNQNTNDI